MFPTKLARSLRAQMIGVALFATWTPFASANVFGDAWDCAKGSAEAGYQLAGKGAKALEVLGTAPTCVALATSGDIPLYATTGALFTLNAIDSSVVSSNNCVASVKANAVVPMAKLLKNALPNGAIPENLLDAGSQKATDDLWEFMSETAPFSAAIERVDCGCTFLEAGVSVQNLVEIFTIIAQAGEKCDAALSNIPGYQAVKATVEDGATAMNNLGEDIFTDQIQHMDVEEYYFHDFNGGVDSYATRSHAAALILDPSHNWRTQEGATFLSETYVKVGGGANNGTQYANTCRNYFDSHKMSAKNAAKVCEAMVQRFDVDYKSMVARMSGQNVLIKQLDVKLPLRKKQALAECGKRFPPEGAQVSASGYYTGSGANVGAHNHCANAMSGAVGGMEWHSPYNVVGGLGFPVDPADIDAMLATGKPYFFMHPIAMSGVRKIAFEAFENNGGNVDAAVAQGLLAYQMIHDKTLKDSQAIHDKMDLYLKQQKADKIKAMAGFAFPHCPVGAGRQDCIDALGEAVDVCVFQTTSVPLKGEFPKPGEQAKIDAIQANCDTGFVALAKAYAKRKNEDVAVRAKLVLGCPKPGSALRVSCLVDLQGMLESCQGGMPELTTGYFESNKFAQDPPPEVSCAIGSALFTDKWHADDVQIGRINSAVPAALKACNAKVPDFAQCQTQVGTLADACRSDLQASANILLSGVSLKSEEMGNAKGALAKNADACIEQMMAVSTTLGAGKEAEVLMLKQYGNRCMRNESCKLDLSKALAQCAAGSEIAPASKGPGARRAVDPNSGRSTGPALGVVPTYKLRAHIQNVSIASSPVTAVMKNPSAFSAGKTLPQLAKTPGNQVFMCAEKLEAVLEKYDLTQVPNAAAQPAPVKFPVLTPNTNTGVIGPARAKAPPAPATSGRPMPRVIAPTDSRRPAPVLPNPPITTNRLPAATTAPVSMQSGTDRMGGDFRGFALDQSDPQLCRQACAEDNACRSYTYVNPGLKAPKAMCFLKKTTPPATPNDCCTSGAKLDAQRR